MYPKFSPKIEILTKNQNFGKKKSKILRKRWLISSFTFYCHYIETNDTTNYFGIIFENFSNVQKNFENFFNFF